MYMDDERCLRLEVLKSEVEAIRALSNNSIQLSIAKAKALGKMDVLKEDLEILLTEEMDIDNKRIIENQIEITTNEINNIKNTSTGADSSNLEIKDMINSTILNDIESLKDQ